VDITLSRMNPLSTLEHHVCEIQMDIKFSLHLRLSSGFFVSGIPTKISSNFPLCSGDHTANGVREIITACSENHTEHLVQFIDTIMKF
jgi:hypothetical protein